MHKGRHVATEGTERLKNNEVVNQIWPLQTRWRIQMQFNKADKQ